MIYLANQVGTSNYKIGFSKNPQKRLKALQTGNSEKVVLIETWEGFRSDERDVHSLLELDEHRRKVGEWFNLCQSEVQALKTYCDSGYYPNLTTQRHWFYISWFENHRDLCLEENYCPYSNKESFLTMLEEAEKNDR